MTLQERLRELMSALPSERSSVILTRSDLKALLADAPEPDENGVRRDLTVDDVAQAMGRAPSTVRGWLIAGDLRGYKLNGRDWRIPTAALEAFRARQMESDAEEDHDPVDDVDIAAWRKLGS